MKIAAAINGEDWKDSSVVGACRSGIGCYHTPSRAAVGRACQVDNIGARIRDVGGVEITVIRVNHEIAFDVDRVQCRDPGDLSWRGERFATVGRFDHEKADDAGRIGE